MPPCGGLGRVFAILRMRAPYIFDGGWNLKNKISQELVFLWLPPVSNQFLSLSHGFPMISDGFP